MNCFHSPDPASCRPCPVGSVQSFGAACHASPGSHVWSFGKWDDGQRTRMWVTLLPAFLSVI